MPEKPTYEELERRIQELEKAELKRNRAEQAQRESEERLSKFINSAGNSYHILDADFKILEINRGALEAIYLADPAIKSKDQIVGQKFEHVYPFLKDELPHFSKVIKTGKQYANEKTVSHPKLGELVITSICFKVGDGLGIIAENITDRRRAEKALRKTAEALQLIIDCSPAAIISLDRDTNVTMWNSAAEHIFGWNKEEVMGKPYPAVPEDNQDEFMSIIRQQLKGKGLKGEVLRRQRKDGSKIYVSTSSAPLRDTKGNVAGLLSVMTDITERKRTENALRESEERLKSIVKNAAVGIYQVTHEGKFLMVNPRLSQMFGYKSPEDFIASVENMYQLYVNPHERPSILKKIQTSGFVDGVEIQFRHRDGHIVSTMVSVRAIKSKTEGTIYEGFMTDITNYKRAEEALRESEEKLRRSKKMESIGLLAGGVAHDLNNVLSGIVSYPELMLLDLPVDSNLRKPIETIQASGLRATAIVQDLLTVARGVATAKAPLKLNDLVIDYLNSPEFKRLKLYHPAITTKTNLDSHLFNIHGSNVHIRKIVMNLVSNASEAIDGNGNITISTINRYIDRPLRGYDDVKIGEYAVLSVSDDGSGIASDDLERIFEPFYTKKVMGRSGTGLGLAVVWNVVQNHGGYIDVTSDENGTTFELYFPITRDEIANKDLSIPIENYKGNGETILVVDDEESQRDISCKMLEKLAYRTKAVSSGEEAVEYLREHTVDLILLDMIMGSGMNGRETYERIVKIHPNQKAIIVSGFAETDDVAEAQKLGAGSYLKKPLTLEKVGTAVREELKK